MDPDGMFFGITEDDDPIPLPGPKTETQPTGRFRIPTAFTVIGVGFILLGVVLTIAAFDVLTYKVIGPLVLCGGIVLLIVGAVLFYMNREKAITGSTVPAGFVPVSAVPAAGPAYHVVPPYQVSQNPPPAPTVPVIQVSNAPVADPPQQQNHVQDRNQPTMTEIEGATIASSGSHSSLTDLTNANDSGPEAPDVPDTDGFFGLVKRRTRSFYVGGIHPQTNLTGMQKFFAKNEITVTYIKLFKCKAGNRLGAQVDVVKSDAHKLLNNELWPPGTYCKRWVNWKKVSQKTEDENKPYAKFDFIK